MEEVKHHDSAVSASAVIVQCRTGVALGLCSADRAIHPSIPSLLVLLCALQVPQHPGKLGRGRPVLVGAVADGGTGAGTGVCVCVCVSSHWSTCHNTALLKIV